MTTVLVLNWELLQKPNQLNLIHFLKLKVKNVANEGRHIQSKSFSVERSVIVEKIIKMHLKLTKNEK